MSFTNCNFLYNTIGVRKMLVLETFFTTVSHTRVLDFALGRCWWWRYNEKRGCRLLRGRCSVSGLRLFCNNATVSCYTQTRNFECVPLIITLRPPLCLVQYDNYANCTINSPFHSIINYAYAPFCVVRYNGKIDVRTMPISCSFDN